MNRLSFGMKFSLVSVLFFVPMLLSNYYRCASRTGPRRHANGAAESGIARFDPAGTAQHGGLEGLVRIESIIGQTGNVEALGTRLSRIEAELSAQLQALAPVSDAPEQVAEFNARRDELVAGLRAAQAEQSLQSKAAMAETLLGQSQVMIKLVAGQSGLSQTSSARFACWPNC